MKRTAFTMIEMIFVIIVIGILAAAAVMRLASTRDDTKAAAIKTDIATAIIAAPSWYIGQSDSSILNAMSLDTTIWKKSTNIEEYIYSDNGPCVKIAVWDQNGTSGVGNPAASVATDAQVAGGGFNHQPILRIIKGSNPSGPACSILWSDMKLKEINITMGGELVKY